MKKNILIALSLTFSLIGFSEMKVEINEHKKKCLGGKAKDDHYSTIYDSLKRLINDKNCSISKIKVLPQQNVKSTAVMFEKPNCDIEIANTDTKVKIVFDIDDSKTNKPYFISLLKKIGRNLEAEKKTIETELYFRRGKNQSLRNVDDYFYGNKDEGIKGFRELAVEAGVCGPMEQGFVNESNQPAYAHSSSSTNK